MTTLRSLLAVSVILAGPGCGIPDRTPPVAGPHAVHLTWRADPTTTMTVQWMSSEAKGGDRVHYGRAGEELDRTASGTHHPFPHSDLTVHVVELQGLEPGTDYRFRIEGGSEAFAFRTIPSVLDRRISFIVGGDVYEREIDESIYRVAARLDPMFVVIGGDIVYDEGRASRAKRWPCWLESWQRLMVAPDGRLIPLVAAIGNHEVAGQYGGEPRQAPFFYSLLAASPERAYRVLDFGDYMSLVLLDSGHTCRVQGEQAQWLEQTLAERADVPHLFAVYHVPAFPSVRGFNGRVSRRIREHWVPEFERYGVDAAFEHHDHAYKRTHRIKAGRVDPAGVLYLGDGGWGAHIRNVRRVDRTWYLARAEPAYNFIITILDGTTRTYRAIGAEGSIIDEVEDSD